MNAERDPELDRLLGEYREDLRRQEPAPDLLARARQAAKAERAPVLGFPSRPSPRIWMAGLAAAASLLVMVAVFRNQPGVQPAVSNVPQETTAAHVPVPAESAKAAVEPAAGEPEKPEPPAKVMAAKKKEIPSPRPLGLPSMQASGAADAAPVASAPPQAIAEGAAIRAEDKAAAPPARVSTETDAPRRAEHHSLAVVATVVQEVWTPGHPARMLSGSYQRLADGREVRSVLAPVDAPPLAQNSQGHFGLAAPAQQQQAIGNQVRRQAPIRDQIQEARSRMAGPQLTPLGETVVEGFRCVGTRTLEGDRTIERWRSPELGLDLLVRTTEASGAQTIVRYTRIERR